MKKICLWAFVFTLLGSVSYWVLHPNHSQSAFASTIDSGNRAVVFDKQVNTNNIFHRVLAALVRAEVICAVDQSVYTKLKDSFNVETETMTVKGDTIELIKVPCDEVTQGKLRRFLKENNVTKCTSIPFHSWFYLVFSGTVS